MTSTKPLSQQIADIEARRNAVINARREREQQEARELREIAETTAQLAALRKQEAEQQFGAWLRKNNEAVQANNADVAALFKALASPLEAIRGVYPQLNAVDASFDAQQRVHDNALNAAQGAMPEFEVLPEHDPEFVKTALAEKNLLRSYEGQITPALPAGTSLFKWVAEAKTPDDYRMRQGIAYAITGTLYTVNPQNLPTDASIRNQLSTQVTRIRG